MLCGTLILSTIYYIVVANRFIIESNSPFKEYDLKAYQASGKNITFIYKVKSTHSLWKRNAPIYGFIGEGPALNVEEEQDAPTKADDGGSNCNCGNCDCNQCGCGCNNNNCNCGCKNNNCGCNCCKDCCKNDTSVACGVCSNCKGVCTCTVTGCNVLCVCVAYPLFIKKVSQEKIAGHSHIGENSESDQHIQHEEHQFPHTHIDSQSISEHVQSIPRHLLPDGTQKILNKLGMIEEPEQEDYVLGHPYG
uniref:Protein shifted n=1 Tax=Rhabditophanes sp. KR3021 TaxID=114890 RepID=A0AC35TM03_9BILA